MSGIKRASWYEYRIGILKGRPEAENDNIINKLKRRIRKLEKN